MIVDVGVQAATPVRAYAEQRYPSVGSRSGEDKHHEITWTTWRKGQDRPKRGSCTDADKLQWVR